MKMFIFPCLGLGALTHFKAQISRTSLTQAKKIVCFFCLFGWVCCFIFFPFSLHYSQKWQNYFGLSVPEKYSLGQLLGIKTSIKTVTVWHYYKQMKSRLHNRKHQVILITGSSITYKTFKYNKILCVQTNIYKKVLLKCVLVKGKLEKNKHAKM